MVNSTLAVRLLVVLCLVGGEQHAGVAARHSKGKRGKSSAWRSRSSGGGTPREDAWEPVRAPLEGGGGIHFLFQRKRFAISSGSRREWSKNA